MIKKRSPLAIALCMSGLVAASSALSSPTCNRSIASIRLLDEYSQATLPEHPADWPWTTWDEHRSLTTGRKLILLGLKGLLQARNQLNSMNLHHTCAEGDDACMKGEHPTVVSCGPETIHARTADGTCNHLESPMMGAAKTRFGRNIRVDAVVKTENVGLETEDLKQIRKISRELLERRDGKIKETGFLNLLAASWIQFENHDWLNHENADLSQDPYVIPLEPGDPLGPEPLVVPRSVPSSNRDANARAGVDKSYINTNTHWWDGSQLYGSSEKEITKLRAFKDGLMRVEERGGQKGLLPIDSDSVELAGFKRNWWVGISMLHHVFTLEHNAIAKKIKEASQDSPEFKAMTPKQQDQWLFDKARLVNVAVMAKIHTVEWTPGILNNPTLKAALCMNWYGLLEHPSWNKRMTEDSPCNWRKQVFGGQLLSPVGEALESYLTGQVREIPAALLPVMKRDEWHSVLNGLVGADNDLHGVPYTITEEFTSVYRLHSLIPDELRFIDRFKRPDGTRPSGVTQVETAQTREEKAHPLIEQHGAANLFYSFGTSHPGSLTLGNYPSFMTRLEIPVIGRMDLATVDILRDRERGVPRYNEFRRQLHLKPIHRFEDLFKQPFTAEDREQIAKLKEIYKGDVEKIDLLVGTLAEGIRPDGYGFGETQFQIFILMASRRLHADRFFSHDYYTPETYTKTGLEWIDEASFRNVLVRHYPELDSVIPKDRNPFFPWNE